MAITVTAEEIFEKFLAEISRLHERLHKAETERDKAVEFLAMKLENLNPHGKTILDFQAVWIRQARERIEKLEAELKQSKEAK